MASMPVALIPFLQNSRVAALSKRPRADSSSPQAMWSATIRFFVDDLPMRQVNRTAPQSSSDIFTG
jgi:hypothetical protein